MKLVFKNLPIKKNPTPNGFIGEFHQIFEEEWTLLHQFNEDMTLIPNLDKSTITKLQTSILYYSACRNPYQNISELNPTAY